MRRERCETCAWQTVSESQPTLLGIMAVWAEWWSERWAVGFYSDVLVSQSDGRRNSLNFTLPAYSVGGIRQQPPARDLLQTTTQLVLLACGYPV